MKSIENGEKEKETPPANEDEKMDTTDSSTKEVKSDDVCSIKKTECPSNDTAAPEVTATAE